MSECGERELREAGRREEGSMGGRQRPTGDCGRPRRQRRPERSTPALDRGHDGDELDEVRLVGVGARLEAAAAARRGRNGGSRTEQGGESRGEKSGVAVRAPSRGRSGRGSRRSTRTAPEKQARRGRACPSSAAHSASAVRCGGKAAVTGVGSRPTALRGLLRSVER